MRRSRGMFVLSTLLLCACVGRDVAAEPLMVTEPDAPWVGGFGFALGAVGGDVVVGAPLSQLDVVDGGAAFRIDPATGAVVATYRSPDPGRGDYFGFAVVADATRIFISSPQSGPAEDGGSAGNGVVHVFDMDSGMPSHTIVPPSGAWGFGEAIAHAGDLVVVGAPFAGDDLRGRVYVYDTTTLSLLQTIEPPAGAGGWPFGAELATDGERVAIHAAESDRGVVQVWNGRTGALLYVVTPSTPGDGGSFGSALSLANGQLAVGAPGQDEGSISVHAIADGALARRLTAPECNNFGEHVAFTGSEVLTPCGGQEMARLVDVASGATLAAYSIGESTGVDSVAVVGDRVLMGAGGDRVYVFSRPVCGDGVVTHEEQCDGGACCDAICRFVARGRVCGQGDLCTTPVCDGAGACAPSPGDTCIEASSPEGAFLDLRRASRSRARWRLEAVHGPAPATDVDYALCLFDVAAARTTTIATMPAAERCGGRSCWSASPRALAFRSGADELQLRRAADGRTRIRLRARDVTLASDAMPAAEPLDLRVELRNAAGQCWTSRHLTALRNDGRVLRAPSP